MKKIIAILLIALCFLTACGEGSESKAPAKNDSAGNATDNGSADTENSGNDDKKDETAIDDGLPTVFMPTAVYFSPERSEKDVNKIEYDEFGNMTVFTNIGETYNKVNKSEINYDDQGRVTKVKNYHRDVYFFEYAEDGSLSKITGSLNYGNDSFTFEPDFDTCALLIKVLIFPNFSMVLITTFFIAASSAPSATIGSTSMPYCSSNERFASKSLDSVRPVMTRLDPSSAKA